MDTQNGHAAICLDEQVRRHARSAPERVCVRAIDHSSQLTYGELDEAATRVAGALRAGGISPGSRVALGFGNTPECLATLLGCFRAGVVAAPLDPSLASRELREAFALLQPSALLVDTSTHANLQLVSADYDCRSLSVAAMLEHTVAEQAPATASQSAGLILCTSGTTGSAKGAVLSQAGLDAKLHALTQWFGIDETFTSLCILPTHFGHGLIANCLTTLYAGATLVLGPPFNLDVLQDLWQTLVQHRITNFSTVPTMVRLLLALGQGSERSKLPALRFVTCASAPLLPDEILAFEDSFGAPLLNCYGLTETSSWSTCSRVDGRDLRSVGWPVGCAVRAVNAAGQTCAAGERGELQIAGPSVLTEYFKSDSQTALAFQEGWFRTGDLGEVDASGQVFVHARIKDMIIRAGKNVFPSEIDAVLLGHPAVAEACCFGLPDPLLGEKVAACVVVSGDAVINETELFVYARSQLADYKCPEQIVFVTSIPKTTRGKVRRADVRSMFEESRR